MIDLNKPFAANSAVDEGDVRPMKIALNRLGYYLPPKDFGATHIVDRDVFEGLKRFQKDHGLLATGVVKPGDPTERALNDTIESQNPDQKYVWRTRKDDKVRPVHADREGQIFTWGNTPDGGHPGEDFGCRCWAESVGIRRTERKAEGLRQEVIERIEDVPKKWETKDFREHFKSGNGSKVTLSKIGYLGDVIAKSEDRVFPRVEDQVAHKMRQIISGPLIYSTDSSYDFSDVHWVLGNGSVHTRTVGTVERDGNVLSITAIVSYDYSDEITDPLGIRQLYRGPHRISDLPNSFLGGLELRATDLAFGKAYAVVGSWKTSLTGSISLNEQ